ncbi:MAG: PQQ-dependent sugar dehydrogenase [Saprospiraceae bacterium]|nr:PQQ-dependent sugar dehydrogenase [Saprospiraceae bacterium]
MHLSTLADRLIIQTTSLLSLLVIVSCGPSLPPSDPDNGGLTLPGGFEAVVVADSIGRARHMAVRDNGDIYVKLRTELPEGENIAMRDTDGDGKADIIEHWGSYDSVSNYGTAMRIYKDYLYLSTAGQVFRHKLPKGKLVPEDAGELIVFDDYKNADFGYEHNAKPITFDDDGHLYVPFGAPGDVCQVENRKPGSPGQFPCPQLEWHGGVWQFDANKPNQLQRDGKLYATGIRSIVGMDWNHQENELYALQHGRDNFTRNWPDQYTAWQSALLPSEEFFRVEEGMNGGWPYFYYDQLQGKKLVNPEYLEVADQLGDPMDYEQPLIGFPGHFAPNDLLFYEGDQFPERYRHGAFIAFHGSTIRAPYPQGGYFVAFVPFANGRPSGPWEVFADGFGGVDTIVNTSDAHYRPMGLAMGPDGSLYITESEKGKIWRVMYKGERKDFGPANLAEMEKHKQLPHIKDPDEVLDNLDHGRARAGEKLYVTYCGVCHVADGKGDGTRYPPLNNSEYVNGDPHWLINLLLKGREGQITVNGQAFEGVMPPFDYLENEQIAQILTYIRQSFGNESPSIQSVEVERIRRRNKRMEAKEEAGEDI